MRIPFSPYTKVTPVDLPTRMKFCFVDGKKSCDRSIISDTIRVVTFVQNSKRITLWFTAFRDERFGVCKAGNQGVFKGLPTNVAVVL